VRSYYLAQRLITQETASKNVAGSRMLNFS
jgi:hypothetical protein